MRGQSENAQAKQDAPNQESPLLQQNQYQQQQQQYQEPPQQQQFLNEPPPQQQQPQGVMEGLRNRGAERAVEVKKTKCLATAGIVTGSIGVCCCYCGIPAIALGGVACCRAKKYGKHTFL